jgi:excisionase family DNA binding protein
MGWRGSVSVGPHQWAYGGTMTQLPPEPEALLTPAEVAALFRVDPKTVTRWAKAGKLSAIRTLVGHRRYRASEVQSLLDGLQSEAPPPSASA